MRVVIVLLLWFFFSAGLTAQSSCFTKGHTAYSIFDRIHTNTQIENNIHTSVKHYYRKDIVGLLNKIDQSEEQLSLLNQSFVDYLHKDNIDFSNRKKDTLNKKTKGLLQHFYISEGNFYQLEKPNLALYINPVLNLRFGKEKDSENPVFQNTRGIEIKGLIDDKIYFYTNIIENQANFYNYINERIDQNKSIPGQGFYKDYQSSIVDKVRGFDYLNSEAYLGVPVSKSLTVELGHGTHFIGNGYRSLLLSDYANNYFYLKLNLNVWKFHYQSVFAELASISSILNPSDNLLSKKYMASHYFSFKPSNKFEIGLFETVVFAREDHFEFQYLNPVILYRTVEQFIDSPDNVLIGLNGRWDPIKNLSLYGQLILDEFKIKELTSGNGWWANKYGMQLGLKYFEVLGIENIDLQLEYNFVRPFTYGHRDTLSQFPDISVANYSHYGQELAHPLGSNFHETIVKLNYYPTNKVKLEGKLLYAMKGENDLDVNYGGNLFLPSETRTGDYGFGLTDGVRNKISSISLTGSYEFFHNFHLDLTYLYRKSDSEDDTRDLNTNYIGFGLRVNVANYKIDY